jgi:serine/threonine protein kinase
MMKDAEDFLTRLKSSIPVHKTFLIKQVIDAYSYSKIPPDFLQILITEKTANMSLHDRIQNPAMTQAELKSYIVQALATLHMLSRKGIRHNDLHLRNILVAPGIPMKKTYTVGRDKYTVDLSEGRILLFDWDASSAPEWCGDNPYLEGYMCDTHGMCNDSSKKYDLVFFMYALKHSISNNKDIKIQESFGKFYSRIVDKIIPTMISKGCKGIMCGRISNTPQDPDSPQSVPSIAEVLKDPYFKQN